MDNMVYNLSRHVTYRIARLHARLDAQATEILKTHAKISLSEWRVLAVLTNPSVETQKDVLEAMGLDKGQISRTLKRLEANGFINLALSEHDHRQRQISLTGTGDQLVKKMFPIMMERQAHLQSGLEAGETDKLFELIEKLEQKSGHLTITDGKTYK